MGVPYSRTKDNFESQMAVNYLGHFLLTHLLMPQIIAGSNDLHINSRIINVSSCAHFAGKINYEDFNCEKYYHMGEAYADSKLAQMMFTRYLERICREKSWNVSSYAPHPGVVNTDIFQNSVVGSFGFIRRAFMKVSGESYLSL
jgi:NAD(P)-dependent dehydrogenase (short-subunit alcohol dehydrogenase family)